MLRICATLGFIFFTSLAFAADAAPESLFQTGLAAYQNKQFPEAKAAFEQLLKDGHQSAEVLHNLALTQYQLGEKPYALALWRKALMLEPSNSAARNGREYVEKELNERGFERGQISAYLRETLEYLSLHEMLWLVALALAVTGWIWLRYISARKAAFAEVRPLPEFPTAAVILSVLFFGTIGLTIVKAQQALQVRATVLTASTQARSLPNEQAVTLFELRGGAEVLIRRQDKNWLQILNSSGASGWIKDSELFITSSR